MASQTIVQPNSPDPLPATSFGTALKFLRKRARLTQDELGRAVGYSREQIARLENGSRLPNLTILAALFVPALELQREPLVVARLLELAGTARQTADPAETPTRVTVTHTVQKRVALEQTIVEPLAPLALSSSHLASGDCLELPPVTSRRANYFCPSGRLLGGLYTSNGASGNWGNQGRN